MIIESILDLNLHDSELLEISIDKADLENDKLVLHLNYIEDYQSLTMHPRKLVFLGCRKTVLNINFGVNTIDTINSGVEIEKSQLLDEVSLVLAKMKLSGPNRFKHFHIETILTASSIDVIAEKIEFL